MEIHPLNDNNTQEALEGLLKAVEQYVEEDKKKEKLKQQQENKDDK